MAEGEQVEPPPNAAQEAIQELLGRQGVRPGTVEAVVAVAEQTQGPFPPPSMLAGYEQTLPGAADRIFALAERRAEHRQQLEVVSLQSTMQLRSRGQIFAFIIAMSTIIVGAMLLAIGREIEGFVLILGATGAIAATFITGRRANGDDNPPDDNGQ